MNKKEEKLLGRFAANPSIAIPSHQEKEEERTRFHRDRDRIIYSRAFRRLKGKTQVFLAGYDDHVRNRLTHTLEVSQLATSIAVSLNLNLMLTEAIALGHDLGHTPFGHVGERVLNDIMNKNNNAGKNKGFKHNWQSIRVVEFLEIAYRKYSGLNLTDYTRWGILNHSSLEIKDCEKDHHFYMSHPSDIFSSKSLWTFEGCLVELADEIAQRHHDFEDGFIVGLIDHKELLDVLEKSFNHFLKDFNKQSTVKDLVRSLKSEKHKRYFLPLLTKYIIHFYVKKSTDLMKKNILKLIKHFDINKADDFINHKDQITTYIFGGGQHPFYNDDEYIEFRKNDKTFQGFLKDRVLNSHQVQQMDGRSKYIIENLFKAYFENPQQLDDSAIISLFAEYNDSSSINNELNPKEKNAKIIGNMREELKKLSNNKFKQCLQRTIADQIAGMTDEYATYQYEVMYGAREMKNW